MKHICYNTSVTIATLYLTGPAEDTAEVKPSSLPEEMSLYPVHEAAGVHELDLHLHV